jgi:hypothetical protein
MVSVMMNANEYTVRFSDLLRREHGALADFLVELATFDQRALWRDLGHASLFDYLHRALGLSRGAAYYRNVGADLVRRFPEIVDPLRDGRLCVSTLVALAKAITPENRAAVLPRFFHRSKAEAKAIAAEIRPAEVVPRRELVTEVRPAASRAAAAAERASATLPGVDAAQSVMPGELGVAPAAVPAPPAPPAKPRDDRPVIEPLTADLARLHITVPRRLLEKLDRARDAISHAKPGATTAEILEAALDLVIDRAAKRRGLVAKPQKKLRPAKPDRVRASVLREVWERDGGRCQFRLPNGEICGSTVGLEVHHREARARGGGHTAEDLVLHCKPHHRFVTRKDFGDEWVERCIRRRREHGRAGARGSSVSENPLRPEPVRPGSSP